MRIPGANRNFILISNTVDTSKSLSLNSLTGYGRLDVICRCISNAFFLSNNFRRDVVLYIFFIKNKMILRIEGATVRGINPDEKKNKESVVKIAELLSR